MAQAEIGALRVRLAMDAGEFHKGARDAEISLAGLANRLGITAKNAAIAFAIKGVIDKADELGKAAQKIGIPVEALSQLKHAADLSGISMETLSNGVKKLSVNMEEIAGGGTTSGAARSLAALGISAMDASGQLKGAEMVMLQLADRFRAMEDGAGKTALAVAIFGKSGVELIPLLNAGSAGIEAMKKEADALGISFDTRAAKAAEAFNDNISRLGAVFTGFATKLTVAMLPALERLSERFVDFAKSSGIVDAAVAGISTSFKGLVTVGLTLGTTWEALTEIITRSANIVQAAWASIPVFFELTLKGAANFVAIAIEGIVNDFVAGLAKIGYAVDAFGLSSLGDTITNSLSIDLGRLNTDEAAAKLAELGATAAQQLTGGFTGVTESVRQGIAEIETLWSSWAATMEATATEMPDKVAAPIIASTEAMAEAARQHNKAMQDGKRITEEMLTPQEALIARQQKIADLFRQGAISAETYGRAMAQASAFSAKNMDALASNVSSNLSTIFGETKAVAIATALINTYQGITKALATYPPPMAQAMAAIQAAAGFAQVANIRSQTKGGGGGGGSGGGGSAAAPGPTQIPQTLVVEGLTPGRFLPSQNVRELAQMLIDYQRDGGQVVIR
jgi:hypothetical protein